MASFDEHCQDCERLLGNRHEDVNRWIDSEFARFGPLHRFMNHHNGGIEEAFQRFGIDGANAAMIHILKDCGWIPTKQAWMNQTVDSLGMQPDKFSGYWDPDEFDRTVKILLRVAPSTPRP